MKIPILLLPLALYSAALAQNQPATPAGRSEFGLTVYSTADPALFDPQDIPRYRAPANSLPGFAVVRETRKIELSTGENTLRFADVASGIDPTTVSFQSLTAPLTTTVLEQNYEYDLVNFDALLQKFVNKEITITRNGRTFQALLLASDGISFIYREGSDPSGPVQVMARDPNAIQLPDTRGLNTKPTLVWKISAQSAGQHDAQVTYQTSGVTWRADYNLVVNQEESAADIGAWVTLLNQSGASYPDAKLKLVAGDVHRVKPPEQRYAFGGGGFGGGGGGYPAFVEKPFFEYHLYTLGRQTSLANNSTKQIELFPSRQGIPISKIYVYYGLPEQMRYAYAPSPTVDRNPGSESNKKVDIYLVLQNGEKNGMGIPLPAGRIRVYKQDASDKSLEFIGEDVIQHTAKDEQVMVRLGSGVDITGERKQTDFVENSGQRWMNESFEIKLRNHKKEPATIIIKENLFRWFNWEITSCTDKFEKQDYRTIHIPIVVAPDEEKTVTYTVKYTW